MKKVYIILTKSNSIVSKAIDKLGDEPVEYTHSSISFSNTLQPMYSFGRYYARFMLPAGLKKEPLDEGFYKLNEEIPVGVYSLEVSDEAIDRMQKKIDTMFSDDKEYKYSALGLVYARVGIDKKRDHRYFCSQFVAEILNESGEIHLDKKETLCHPMDFLNINGIKHEFTGQIKDLVGKEF